MKKLLTAGLMLLSMQTFANPDLSGKWSSVTADGLAMHGVIELGKNGSAKLSPQGNQVLTGTWSLKGKELVLDMPPHGTARMGYELKNGKLTLTYDNGAKQVFSRNAAVKAKPSPRK